MSMIGDRVKALEALKSESKTLVQENKPEASELGFSEESIEIIKRLTSQETAFVQSNKDDRTLMDVLNEMVSLDDGRVFSSLLDIICCITDKRSEKLLAKNPIEIEWQILGLKQLAHEKVDEMADEIR